MMPAATAISVVAMPECAIASALATGAFVFVLLAGNVIQTLSS